MSWGYGRRLLVSDWSEPWAWQRPGVPQSVVALEESEVLARGPSGKAIAWVSRDAQRIGDEESVRPIVCGAIMPRGGRERSGKMSARNAELSTVIERTPG